MIKILFILMILAQPKGTPASNKMDIEITTKKSETYEILTKSEPISFAAEGPTYLRIYTRIPWPKDAVGSKIYKLILQENETTERMITFESDVSKVTKDKQGRFLSKWRSFYIEVPDGKNIYKIINWSSPKDTILIKFSYEAPKSWQDIPAAAYKSIIEAVEEEKIIKYYELTKDGELVLEINEATRLQVVSRLNYDEKMMGEQNYTIIVSENGKELKRESLKCYKSEIVQYKDRKDLVPSNARSFFVNLRAGRHVLKFKLNGTIAPSASLKFSTEQK